MQGNSRHITTNQLGPHEKLDELVRRYQSSVHKRPVQAHTEQAFDAVCQWLGDWQGPIILDSCCGVGESTSTLAERYPDCKVIGVDKSAARVDKHTHYATGAENYVVCRADVNDFWHLVRQAKWAVKKHYLLYPNPYPKSAHIQKRWHGSPAFADIMALSDSLEVRSNWLIYLQECNQAASHYGWQGEITPVASGKALTPFERKYTASGQPCWQLLCHKFAK